MIKHIEHQPCLEYYDYTVKSESNKVIYLQLTYPYKTAKNHKKEVIEIEGVKFQVDMFDSFSDELQVQYLAGTLAPWDESKEEGLKTINDLVEAWKKGNTLELEKLAKAEDSSTEELKEFNEKMWTTRDNNMTEKVKSYLADPEKKTYFVVVGAGHMVGKSGIVTQLEGEYKIEQIK